MSAFSTSDTISTFLINSPTDHLQSSLLIDGDIIHLQEGTTQGDLMAMLMYAIATVPLIKRLTSNVKQTWCADNAAATGKVTEAHTTPIRGRINRDTTSIQAERAEEVVHNFC